MEFEIHTMHGDLHGLRKAIYEGDAQKAKEKTEMVLNLGYNTASIVENALFPAMKEIGEQLRKEEIFIPEVLMSARAMKGAMYALKPFMTLSKGTSKGTVVIGTVAGDYHDLGKNMVIMMLKGRGFFVVDLGTDVTADVFIEAVKTHNPDILAMSALLTTTLFEMKIVIDAITEAKLRTQVTIMVGGAPVTERYAREIKADIYTNTMFEAGEAAEDAFHRRVSPYAV